MRVHKRLLLFMGAALVIGGAACTGLAGEPEVVSTLIPLPTVNPTAAAIAALGQAEVELTHDQALLLGGQIFGQRCASCHGATGQGDGTVAVSANLTVPDFTQAATLDPQAWLEVITNGRIERMMPNWSEALNLTERQAVALYTYRLGGIDAQLGEFIAVVEGPAAPDVPAEAAVVEVAGSVTGYVVNGTAGAALPDPLTVGLHVIDADGQEARFEVVMADYGMYSFADVPVRSDYTYMVTALHDQQIFYSPVFPGDPQAPSMELPVTIYDVTTDPSVLHISALVTRITPLEDVMQFSQLINLRNTSDKMYRQARTVEEFRNPSVQVALPADAVLLNVETLVERFMLVDNRTLVDTWPVLPGEDHVIELVYEIPRPADDILEVSYPVFYEMTNQVELLLLPSGYEVVSDQLVGQGMQQFRAGTFDSYLGDPLAAGSMLTYTIRPGTAFHAPVAESGSSRSTLALALVLGSGGLGMLLLAGVVYLRGVRPASRVQRRDALVGQIAELDAQHHAGALDEAEYRQRREALKARLKPLMRDKKAS